MESNIQLYHDLYIICGALGLVFIVISLVLYYLFDIKKIIKDMLGINEKTAIKEMIERDNKLLKYQKKLREVQHKVAGGAGRAAAKVRAQFVEQEASEKDKKINQANLEHLESMRQEAEVQKKDEPMIDQDGATDVLVENQIKPIDADAPTVVLRDNQLQEDWDAPTEVLEQNQVGAETSRHSDDNRVQIPEQGYIPRGDTMVLNARMLTEDVNPEKEVKQRQIRFILERQILMTHTDEVIDF